MTRQTGAMLVSALALAALAPIASAQTSGALSGTYVGLLVRNEIGRREEAVLEIVDAESRGFVVRDGAEVARQLHPAFVSFGERGAQLFARDVHVRFERRRAEVVPPGDELSRVFRTGELVHLREIESRSLEVRGRRVDPWPSKLSRNPVQDFTYAERYGEPWG